MWTFVEFVNLDNLLFDLCIAFTAANESMAGIPSPFALIFSIYPSTVEFVHDVVFFPNVLVAHFACHEPFLDTCTGVTIDVS